ncbi:MAG: hypothetical protein WA431_11580 [Candidatus Cybelea sp.]
MEKVMENQEFTIWNLRSVCFGKVRWVFDLRIGPVTLRDTCLVYGEDHKPKFAAPNRIRESTTRSVIPVAEVDRLFMDRVFTAVLERIAEIGSAL